MKSILQAKGISLVALVITIIVLIILTGTVILTMNQGDIMGKSQEAVYRSNIKTFQEELRKNILDKQVESGGSLSKSDVNAGWGLEGEENILYWIPSYTEKYGNKFEVEEGELVYVDDNNTEQEKELFKELAIIRKSGITANPDDFKFSSNTGNMTAEVRGLSEQGKTKIATEVTTLKIPDIVTEDGQNFVVTSIGISAFYACEKLALNGLPNGVTSIGDSTFKACTNLALTSLPDNVTSIGESAFFNCTNLALTNLPDNVTSIGSSAFRYCKNLALTSLPDSITNIGSNAFDGCKSITKLTVPWASGTVANEPWGLNSSVVEYGS